MANNCMYDIHVTGSKEGIDTIRSGFGIPENTGVFFGRIYSAEEYDSGERDGEYYSYLYGDCAWSVDSAFNKNFRDIISKYKLNVEIYSEEPGVGFMEHYMWEYGEMTLNETADFLLWHIDDFVNEEDLEIFLANNLVKKAKITKENYMSFADDDGYIKIGGYDYIWTIN